jgi:hypothetical protein
MQSAEMKRSCKLLALFYSQIEKDLSIRTYKEIYFILGAQRGGGRMKDLGRGAKLMYPPHTSGKENGITIYVFLLETDIPASGFVASANGQSESDRERG